MKSENASAATQNHSRKYADDEMKRRQSASRSFNINVPFLARRASWDDDDFCLLYEYQKGELCLAPGQNAKFPVL